MWVLWADVVYPIRVYVGCGLFPARKWVCLEVVASGLDAGFGHPFAVVFGFEGELEGAVGVFVDESFEDWFDVGFLAGDVGGEGGVGGFDVVPEGVPCFACVAAWEEDVFSECVSEVDGVVEVGVDVVCVVPRVSAFVSGGGCFEELVVAFGVGGSVEVVVVGDEDVPDDEGVFDCSVFAVEDASVEEVPVFGVEAEFGEECVDLLQEFGCWFIFHPLAVSVPELDIGSSICVVSVGGGEDFDEGVGVVVFVLGDPVEFGV